MITNKGERARRVTRLMVEIHYLPSGEMRWAVHKPDKRKPGSANKWEQKSHGYYAKLPKWEDLHRSCAGLPHVVQDVVATMMQDIHCMRIEDLKKPKDWKRK